MNVITWLWRQEGTAIEYTAEHVNTWADQVSRHLSMDHTLCCVTDIPDGIDSSIEILPFPTCFRDIKNHRWDKQAGLPQCFPRLDMFAPDAAERYGKRFVSLDLDLVALDALDPLFDRDEDFVMLQGTRPNRPYNGSMLMMDAGARPQVYEWFTPEIAQRASSIFAGSDQAWIGYVLGFMEATWGPDDGVYCYEEPKMMTPSDDARLFFFPGKRTPQQLADKQQWIRRALDAT